MYGTCQGKKVCLKKKIKELEMTEHASVRSTCVSQKVLFTSGNNQDFMEPEQTKSKWFVIKHLAVTVPKTSGDRWENIPGKRDHQVCTPSLQLPPPGIPSRERNRTSRYTYEIDEKGFHPRKNPSSWEEGEMLLKNGDLYRYGDLS